MFLLYIKALKGYRHPFNYSSIYSLIRSFNLIRYIFPISSNETRKRKIFVVYFNYHKFSKHTSFKIKIVELKLEIAILLRVLRLSTLNEKNNKNQRCGKLNHRFSTKNLLQMLRNKNDDDIEGETCV